MVLKSLNDEDYLLVLSIKGGKKPSRINKIYNILSIIVTGNSNNANFENVLDRLYSKHYRKLFTKNGDSYVLTQLGKKIYNKLMDSLNKNGDYVLIDLIRSIEKMTDNELNRLEKLVTLNGGIYKPNKLFKITMVEENRIAISDVDESI